jgi:putative DNA primase/helicase
VILADNDQGGRKHAQDKAALIHAVAKSVKIVEFPELAPKGDVSDWIALGNSTEELQAVAKAAPPWALQAKKSPAIKTQRNLISHRASDVTPERIEWLWAGRIAVGKLTLIGEKPGLGKSQVAAKIAAGVSNGWSWPCNEGDAPRGTVIIFSAEDGLRDTVVPRLLAAGADMSRVVIISAVTDETGRKTFDLKAHVDLLEAEARRIGDVKLIIIDPISAYMGNADGHSNVETRGVLEPIAEFADRLHIAVVAITHFNKPGAGNQSVMERFTGSIAFIAAARAAFAVIPDEADESRVLFLQVKNNLAPKQQGLAESTVRSMKTNVM